MKQKSQLLPIFLICALFVLFLFSSCTRKVHNCEAFPKIQVNEDTDSISKENWKQIYALVEKKLQFKCNF
jgi:hypothetical protein